MNVIQLDTNDYRCPEVMIKVRRFLRSEMKPGTIAKVKTIEPSSMRDIPFYCSHSGLYVHSSKAGNDGSYEFIICNSEAEALQYEDNQKIEVKVINASDKQVARDKELFELYESIVRKFEIIIKAGLLLCVPSSFGKDSSLVLNAAIEAYLRMKSQDIIDSSYPLIVIHIDTGNEVVPMDFYSHYAMERLQAFCDSNDINLELHHETPPMYESFAALFLGARKLPSTPLLNSDCAVIWKVDTSEKVQKELITRYGAEKLVSCLGSRHDEGVNRSTSIRKFDNDLSVEEMLRKSDKGINTFAPIKDLTNDEVFELLQRIGSQPIISMTPGYSIRGVMPSYRLLIQIYGDSANDTCEINLGEEKTGPAGCGGSARNGCLNCFKAGKVDKAVVAHNQSVRWANLQANANKVRDYMFAAAHDNSYRTHHPRTYDPVTNHAMLQPNILNSRTLERLLTYYVQLTHDDAMRAAHFRRLVRDGREMEDTGYAEISNDPSIDELTRADFLEMYKAGCQRHVIKIATLEHCIFLSAQWAMDGVKALPFRPLAIFDVVVNQGKRIPYPNANTEAAIIDKATDAMAIKMGEPGQDMYEAFSTPFRTWDVMEADVSEGCSTQKVPNTLRVNVKYSVVGDRQILQVKLNGKVSVVGEHTEKALLAMADAKWKNSDKSGPISFSAYLTERRLATVTSAFREVGVKKQPSINFTKRSAKFVKGKVVKGRTSLQMYSPAEQDSLTASHLKDMHVWVPEHVKTTVPFLSNHASDEEMCDVTFSIGNNLSDWFNYGGFEKAINLHNEWLKKLRGTALDRNNGLRQFCGTEAFWMLLQDGVISVNESAWRTAQKTLRRTELFFQVGLFTLPDDGANLATMNGVISMQSHRRLKAGELLKIRHKRNVSRLNTKAGLRDLAGTMSANVLRRAAELVDIRARVIDADFISKKLLISSGITGFDERSFISEVKLVEDWISEFGGSFDNTDAFLSMFASSEEKRFINLDVAAKRKLSAMLARANKELYVVHRGARDKWCLVRESAELAASESVDGQFNEDLHALVKASMPDSYSIYVEMGLNLMSERLSFNKQSMMSMLSEDNATLSDEWHNAHVNKFYVQFDALDTWINALRNVADKDTFGTLTSRATNNALLSLFS